MVDEEKPGFCFSGDAITFDKIHLKLGVWTLQLVGHGCFFASLFYSLISPLASETFLVGRLSISGRVFFLAGSVLVVAAYLIALHRVSVHLRLMRVASVLSALSIISGMLFSALLQDDSVASCVLLGLGLGALAVQWHYYCSVLDVRIADVSYKAVGESTIIAGALFLCMVCMTALYGVALSFILSFTSLAICCLLLYKTYFAYCDVPCFAKDGVGRQAVKSTKPTLSSKALFYNFAYSLLLAWALSFSPQQYLRGFEPQILAIVVILAGVVLYTIWVLDVSPCGRLPMLPYVALRCISAVQKPKKAASSLLFVALRSRSKVPDGTFGKVPPPKAPESLSTASSFALSSAWT